MSFIELFLTSFSLSLDAFSVSICKGLSIKKINIKKCLLVAIYFSFFQMIMPIFGYFLGNKFYIYISKFDHYIVLILLSLIGLNMLKEAKEDVVIDERLDIKTMLILSIATSIDALAVGITFDFLNVNLVLAIILIGIITFIMCFIGVLIGHKIGDKYCKSSLIIGGITLILIGIKTLFEHLL